MITGLEWGRGVSKTAHRARCMRYSVLTRECERLEAGMLMVGHHSNDQIGIHHSSFDTIVHSLHRMHYHMQSLKPP